jgi:glycerophosphoryl diester phosphodiesterase
MGRKDNFGREARSSFVRRFLVKMPLPLKKPICFAHRGAAAELPENTLPSFERALEVGADALEMDLHMTSDGEIVVAHDPNGLRMTGVEREIRASSLSEVKRWDAGFGFESDRGRPNAKKGFVIPTFEEVLDAFPTVLINVDAKQIDPPLVPTLLRLIEKKDAASRVNIASFHDRALRDARRRGYPGTTALGPTEIIAALTLPASALRALRRSHRMGDRAQIPLHSGPIVLARPGFVKKCQAAGILVDFWTVNEPHVAEELALLGADGIMTDDPRTIVPIVKAQRERGLVNTRNP